jgi:hypothetical protein
MALLTVQTFTTAGAAEAALVAAAGGGDTFPNNGRTILKVSNESGGSITVTISAQVACDQGSLHNITNSIADGETEVMGPFRTDRFNDASGLVHVGYSGASSVTVGVYST